MITHLHLNLITNLIDPKPIAPGSSGQTFIDIVNLVCFIVMCITTASLIAIAAIMALAAIEGQAAHKLKMAAWAIFAMWLGASAGSVVTWAYGGGGMIPWA